MQMIIQFPFKSRQRTVFNNFLVQHIPVINNPITKRVLFNVQSYTSFYLFQQMTSQVWLRFCEKMSLFMLSCPVLSVFIFKFRTSSDHLSSLLCTFSITSMSFCSASTLLAMQTAVLAMADLSVCLSVHYVPVFCPDEWTYDHAVFRIRWENYSTLCPQKTSPFYFSNNSVKN